MSKIGDTNSIYKVERKDKNLVAKEGQILVFCKTCGKESLLDRDEEGFKIQRTRSVLFGENIWWQRVLFIRCAICASIEVEVKNE